MPDFKNQPRFQVDVWGALRNMVSSVRDASFLTSFVAVYTFSCVGVLIVVFQFFHCQTVYVRGEPRQHVQAFPSIECGSETYDRLKPVVMIGLLVQFGLLLGLFAWVQYYPRIRRTASVGAAALYELLTGAYRKRVAPYWEFLLLLRRLVLIALSVELAEQYTVRLMACGLACFIFACMHFFARPFRDPLQTQSIVNWLLSHNSVESVSLFLLTVLAVFLPAMPELRTSQQDAGVTAFVFIPLTSMFFWVIWGQWNHFKQQV